MEKIYNYKGYTLTHFTSTNVVYIMGWDNKVIHIIKSGSLESVQEARNYIDQYIYI